MFKNKNKQKILRWENFHWSLKVNPFLCNHFLMNLSSWIDWIESDQKSIVHIQNSWIEVYEWITRPGGKIMEFIKSIKSIWVFMLPNHAPRSIIKTLNPFQARGFNTYTPSALRAVCLTTITGWIRTRSIRVYISTWNHRI